MNKIKTLMEDTHERLEKIDKSLGLIRNTEKTIEE